MRCGCGCRADRPRHRVPSRPASPAGRRGDQAAIRGDTPVRRTPRRNITTATASASAPIIRVGRPTTEPRDPNAAPSTPNPTIRPTLNATCGRIRVTNDASGWPSRVRAAACDAENPRTKPPTIAMHVENPAVRPRTSTSRSPPRDGLARSPTRPPTPRVPARKTTATMASPLRATVIHVDASLVSHAGVPGSYPAERIAASTRSVGGSGAPRSTAVPRRADTSTDSTPGIRSRARPTRFSQASQVIPTTGTVRRCNSSESARVLTLPVRRVRAPCAGSSVPLSSLSTWFSLIIISRTRRQVTRRGPPTRVRSGDSTGTMPTG